MVLEDEFSKGQTISTWTYFTIPILDEVSFRIVIFEEMVSKDTWAYSAMMMRHTNMGRVHRVYRMLVEE